MALTHDQKIRYARHISLPEMGEAAQQKLLNAKVLVIGAGGLGAPALFYLAGAGVGTIGIIDDDNVSLSNLQRQIIHETADVNRPKVQSAMDSMHDLNPDITIIPIQARLNQDNAEDYIKEYDVIIDGCDNFETRFIVNAASIRQQKTLISAAIIGFKGHLYTFTPHLGEDHPCYQCLYPELPPADATPACSESGVLGSLGGIMGSWLATEAIKEITGLGKSLSGSMLIVDALNSDIRKVTLPRDPHCPSCVKA